MAYLDANDSSPVLMADSEQDSTGRVAELRRAKAGAAELAKANEALQATIDALSNLQNLDEMVPRVLEIVAETFGARSCALYQNDPFGKVHLRYWYNDGKTLLPDELLRLDRERFALVRLLADGFEVPDSYLGKPVCEAIGPVVLNHCSGTSVPEFDRFAVETGWDLELNIGVGVKGIRAYSLCLYRSRSEPYTAAEIVLGEALAKQLGLAMEARRLAEEARQVAVAREQEKAARQRANELAKANEALRRSAERLTALDDLQGFLQQVTVSAVEVSGAACGAIGLLNSSGRALQIMTLVDDAGPNGAFVQESVPLSEIPLEGPIRQAWEEIVSGPGYWWAGPDHPGYTPEYRAYHRARGHRQIAHVPIALDRETVGFLALGFREEKKPSEGRLEMLRVLAQQASLAIGLTRLAKREKEAAIVEERERAAQQRAAELALANEALRRGVAGLIHLEELHPFLGEMLRAACETAQAHTGAVVLLPPDRRTYQFAALLRRNGTLEPSGSPLLQPLPVTPELEHYIQGIDLSPESWPLDPDDSLHVPATRAFHAAEGNRALRHVPMRVGERLVGWLGLGFADAAPALGKAHALLQVLADQMTMAVEMARLAEEAQQLAVAREREQAAQERARELAKVNEALRRGLDRVADLDQLDGYMPSLIKEASDVFGADAAAVLLRAGESTAFRPLAVVTDGYAWSAEEIAHDPFLGAFAEVSGRDPDGIMTRMIEQPITSLTLLDLPLAEIWPEAYEYHVVRFGHRISWQFPLRVRGRMLGFLAFALRRPEPPSMTQIESVAALGQQLTLALELTRLAQEAQEAAVARERERTTQERADELARANAGLQMRSRLLEVVAQVSTLLARSPHFDAALLEALRLIGKAAQLSRVLVFLTRPQSGSSKEREHYVIAEWCAPGVRTHAECGLEVISDRDTRQFVEQLGLGRSFWLHIEDVERPLRDYFEQLDIVGTGCAPIFLDNQYAGVVAFDDCSARRTPEAAQVDALTAAANAIAAALQSRRDTERLARERESAARERAAEQEKVNRSLRESVQAMANSSDLQQSLAEVALRIGATAEAQMGVLFSYDETSNTLCNEFWFENGVLHWEPNPDDPPCMHGPFDADVTPVFRYYTAQQQIFYISLDDIDETTRATAWPGTVDWHRAHGRRAACAIPILAGHRPLGIIGLAWTHPVAFRPEQCETLMALSHHVAIVMQLRRLAEQARQAALAKEREQAAQERAQELAKTNEALKQTLDVVAFEPELNQVLGHVLASITKQLGSDSSALWLFQPDSGRFRQHLVYQKGGIVEVTGPNKELLKGIWGSGRDLHLKNHIRDRRPFVYQVADFQPSQERIFAFFQRLGIQSLLGIPLLLGSEIVGSITIRFATARTLQPEELELAQALAHQATMAVQLTRLAERAGEAALSEERARFAREIHDTLAQGFTGILMQLGAISQIEGDKRSDIQPQLAAMTALAQASLAEARRSVRAFRPASVAPDFRLDRAVERSVERVRLQTTAAVSLTVEGAPPQLSPRVESELSGIVQEALNNAVKHAQARHIAVALSFADSQSVSISVEDDGIGFDPAAQAGADCFGLIGMQERAASIGASLTVISEGGRGTEIVVQYGQNAEAS